ncbi:MAG: hypothetical protein GY762_01245, partial [Proteobacteria bacterium]|nr:hypothetical protein [Pseudomonadota bacterium]
MNDTNSNIYNKNALPTYFMPFLHVSTDIPRLMINTIPDSVKCCLAPMTEMRITLYPREIAKRALELASTNILLVHNHPSGDPEPSTADINMTKV